MGLDANDIAYLHKLKKSKRDKRIIAAFLLLLLALRRLRPGATRPEIETEIAPSVGALAAGIAVHVASHMHVTPPRARTIAASLLAAIAVHAARAQQLDALDRDARLGLIARSELQTTTAQVSKDAARGKHVLTRETTSAAPCERCEELAGTYDEPWPDDLFWTHPNCSCLWETNDGQGGI